jgi:hypothetical protein
MSQEQLVGKVEAYIVRKKCRVPITCVGCLKYILMARSPCNSLSAKHSRKFGPDDSGLLAPTSAIPE